MIEIEQKLITGQLKVMLILEQEKKDIKKLIALKVIRQKVIVKEVRENRILIG